MGNLLGGLIVSGLVGVLFAFLYLLYMDSTFKTTEEERKDFIVAVCIFITTVIVIAFSVIVGVRTGYNIQISRVKAVQQSYLDSLQSSYITDLQKVSVANQLASLNGDIAQLKYRKSQWYGFDIPNSINELEIIDLSKIGGK